MFSPKGGPSPTRRAYPPRPGRIDKAVQNFGSDGVDDMKCYVFRLKKRMLVIPLAVLAAIGICVAAFAGPVSYTHLRR